MHSSSFQTDPRDRARSATATAAIHVALGAAFLTGLALHPERHSDDSLKTFDVAAPPPPPPPLSEANQSPSRAEAPTPAAKKANPSPIAAPPPRLATPQPIAAAPVAASGAGSTAGAALRGVGSGAGGDGAGGDDAGRGGGIGTEARLLSGNRSRLPRAMLRPFAADRGYAHLLLTVDELGRVAECAVMQGTGSAAVDNALCAIMIRQSRWSAALDKAGRPITVQVRYTAVWSKD